MTAVVQAHVQHQCSQGSSKVQQCVVLEPLLITGWIHHGHQACFDWGASHPEVKKDGRLLISACMLGKHWIPVVMKPASKFSTWDSPAHDHSQPNILLEAIGKALGFPHVVLERHHRLFFSSDMCGPMAIAHLHHALLGVMLPTCPNEVEVLHHRFRQSFAAAVAQCQIAHRPWIWGAGDRMPPMIMLVVHMNSPVPVVMGF